MARKKGLGRGLQQLADDVKVRDMVLGESTVERQAPSELPVSVIDLNPYQPRTERDADALASLVDSVKRHGVVEPVVVRPAPNGRYELVAGQRRFLAAQQAGLASIPAVVRQLSDEETLVLSLVENLQREDLNPLDEARAFQLLGAQFGLTHEEISRTVGRGRSYVTNSLRLLGLNKSTLNALQAGKLTRGQALALLSLPCDKRSEALTRILAESLSVRQVEALARRSKSAGRTEKPASRDKDPYLRRVVERLEDLLGTRVRVRQRGEGGELVITYSSPGDLNRLLELIQPAESPY